MSLSNSAALCRLLVSRNVIDEDSNVKLGIVGICKYCVVLCESCVCIKCINLEGSAGCVTYSWLDEPGRIPELFCVPFCPDRFEDRRLLSQCVKTTRT
jgi:hypothetical protein